jgi:hypothetical protein
MAQVPSLAAGGRSWLSSPRPTRRPDSTPLACGLHEIVILHMMPWLSEETQKGLREAETFRREQVRMHFRILACFRGEQLADMRGRST